MTLFNEPARLTWAWLGLNGVKLERNNQVLSATTQIIDSDCDIVTTSNLDLVVKSGVCCNIYKVQMPKDLLNGEQNESAETLDNRLQILSKTAGEQLNNESQILDNNSEKKPRDILNEPDAKNKIVSSNCRVNNGTNFNESNRCTIDNTKIVIEESAVVNLTHVILSMDEVYINVNVEMTGRAGRFTAKNAYYLCGNETLDMNYTVRIRAQKCVCDIKSQGSLFDESRKFYRATIDFLNGCTVSKGTETEDVLLLSDKAVNKSLPILLCTEEDVEGVHGATIGRLNNEQLYYLTSRGLNPLDAQIILAKQRVENLLKTVPKSV